MELEVVAKAINDFGFPIIATCGMGYLVYLIWSWATLIVNPLLHEADTVLIDLIDRIRLLDNDTIRLTQKINVVLALRNNNERTF